VWGFQGSVAGRRLATVKALPGGEGPARCCPPGAKPRRWGYRNVPVRARPEEGQSAETTVRWCSVPLVVLVAQTVPKPVPRSAVLRAAMARMG